MIKQRSSRNAFTLVEILTVIAIVAVLLVILIPVLMRVRESGRRATCASNLRQIAMALHQYIQDDDGVYPPMTGDGPSLFEWSDAILPYLKTEAVFQCPDYPQNSTDTQDHNFPQDYGYNRQHLNFLGKSKGVGTMHGTQDALISNPAIIWMNCDSGYHFAWEFEPEGVRLVTQTPCGRDFGGSILHAGGGNYSFVDGHVQWLTPEAMAAIDCLNGKPVAFQNR